MTAVIHTILSTPPNRADPRRFFFNRPPQISNGDKQPPMATITGLQAGVTTLIVFFSVFRYVQTWGIGPASYVPIIQWGHGAVWRATSALFWDFDARPSPFNFSGSAPRRCMASLPLTGRHPARQLLTAATVLGLRRGSTPAKTMTMTAPWVWPMLTNATESPLPGLGHAEICAQGRYDLVDYDTLADGTCQRG